MDVNCSDNFLVTDCKARCCEAFHINLHTLQVLAKEPEKVKDGPYIKDMLIWLSYDEATKRHRTWKGFEHWVPEEGEFYFTCKHWDPETRLCMDYENRPEMCKNTGVIKPCSFRCQDG